MDWKVTKSLQLGYDAVGGYEMGSDVRKRARLCGKTVTLRTCYWKVHRCTTGHQYAAYGHIDRARNKGVFFFVALLTP